MIAVIDYEAGNQTSVCRALESLGIPARITADPEIMRRSEGLIFPGVGAAGQAMEHLRRKGLDQEIKNLIQMKKPFLGICLGCQIMLEYSEENSAETLGILPGRTVRFDPQVLDYEKRPIRIPHMGWNEVRLIRPCRLWEGIGPRDQFYFVHSYCPSPREDLILGRTEHGLEFTSFFGFDGLWAVQFHPEKSGPPGLRLLQNFCAYSREAV
ncbi:MAG: imidazole glycerol phosphate synthase subunit HisH [Deltaproteobacteria bacterium]|jgi:glutamine amidotransferase|nr:imidazole glycerol phosphate synthase subunit HisH [Deltaproteobacteria bacterium]